MSLPVLSYATAHADPPEFIRQLRHALLTTGFLYLSSIDAVVPDWRASWDAAFAASADFFAHDEATKVEGIGMARSRHFRGYSAYGVEVTQGRHDLREQIDLGPDTEPAVEYPPPPGTRIERVLYGPNQYPSFVPALEPALRHWHALCTSISCVLLSLLAESLTPSPSRLTSLFATRPDREGEPAYSRMKVVRYPPVRPGDDDEGGGLGVGAHKDGGGLTLLAQDATGGLQVQLWDGEWVGVEPREYELVINVGQVVERFSAGLYAATTHRVLPTRSSSARLSIPFFFCPRLDALVPVLSPSDIHPALLDEAARTANGAEKKSEVRQGDLHEEVFGLAAWRGITRSHGDVWTKFYGREVDPVGGPEVLA
ncbi:uncharacterized protein RHOBADRAFT_55985 [Rhodotorula graminis WP1]|uniref:Fe2OG dioxygenase domain-containing protein n=1 Tax=Rhodotorula graminis (strain WP1) TaxID=578459 RepID=A0A0N8PZF1_RHOGW|nr:uncharacterized protein RHOBADRAFT_55985 [Rhodotorula graminis WP1]KPV72149.1 hypothetical protein RHOBADRAFT_55985 [Rhodotorula graminis WP1]